MPKHNETRERPAQAHPGKTWEPPTLTCLGHIQEIVQGGGGKLSPSTADPGDVRKPSGLDH